MPTYNRRAFVPRALRSFHCQDYPNRELIVVDDGTDRIGDLLPADPRVRYFQMDQRQNVGAKRNVACQQARGQFVLHWDDDEWYVPSRIRQQVNALRHSTARVSGTSVALFYNEHSDRAFRYSFGGAAAGWMGALAYPVAVWKERPFDCVAIAEDVRFISHVPVNRRRGPTGEQSRWSR
jgi:glycosyltransferase involved in cell wall biosynthesis